MDARPAFKKFLKYDESGFSIFCFAYPSVLLASAAAADLARNHRLTLDFVDISQYLLLYLFGALFSVPIWWRFRKIYRLYQIGLPVPTRVIYTDGKGLIETEHTFEGKSYNTIIRHQKGPATRAIQPGDTLTLLIDPAHPERCVLRDLFIESTGN